MLLDDPQLDRLEAEVLSLLDNVGLRVAHDEVAALLEKRGCRPGPKGRLRIPREVLCEVIESQQARAAAIEKPATDPPPTTPQQAPDEPLPPTPKRFPGFATPQASDGPALLEAAFCPGPIRYYDLERRAAVDLTDAIADDMMRLAEATPEVASVHCWWRRNAEPEVECIANLVLALKLTRKATGLDAIHPAQVKYLVQIGEVLTGDPRSTRYLWGSQCMTPPLILGDRAAEEMLERQRQGVPVYFVATMPMIGVSSPVTRLGSVVMGAAEILGGMTAAHAIAPEGEITGGAFVVCADRTGGQMTTAAPQMAWVTAAVSMCSPIASRRACITCAPVASNWRGSKCGAISSTVTLRLGASKARAVSSPSNPPPTITTLRTWLAYCLIASASSSVRRANTPCWSTPSKAGTKDVPTVASSKRS